MGAVNVTIRVDEETKRDFDVFCDNVGMNITTAINMFIRATLRTRELPFSVTDYDSKKRAREDFKRALKSIQEDSVKNGTYKMTMEEIDAEIAACRREMRDEP